MTLEPGTIDLTAYKGSEFNTSFTLFADPRVLRWRGEYNENWLYKTGDATYIAHTGSAYVAVLETQNTEPGGPITAPFWSPMERWNLTGYTAEFVVKGLFTIIAEIPQPETGELYVEANHSLFEDAPESGQWYLKVSSGTSSYPMTGTILFREP